MTNLEVVELTDPRDYWTNCSMAWHILADVLGDTEETGSHDQAEFFADLATGADLVLDILG